MHAVVFEFQVSGRDQSLGMTASRASNHCALDSPQIASQARNARPGVSRAGVAWCDQQRGVVPRMFSARCDSIGMWTGENPTT